MSEGRRPGGLTALAVINFVYFALGLLMFVGFFTFIAIVNTDVVEQDKAMQDMKKAFEDAGVTMGLFAVVMVVSLISTVLLLLSGIGYLKQKMFLGRGLGTAYGMLALVSSGVSAIVLPPEAGGDFGLGTMLSFIYPIATLFLVNVTFKDDLVN